MGQDLAETSLTCSFSISTCNIVVHSLISVGDCIEELTFFSFQVMKLQPWKRPVKKAISLLPPLAALTLFRAGMI